MTSETLTSGQIHGLASRRVQLAAALAPAGPDRALLVLASLSGMPAQADADNEIAGALLRQAASDLSGFPEFALFDVAKSFRLGEFGDGKWRPTVGEIAREASRRASRLYSELARICRVLDSPMLKAPPRKRTAPDAWETLKAQLNTVGEI